MGERVKLYVGTKPIHAPIGRSGITVKKTKPKRAATARTAQQNLGPPSRRGGFAGGLVSYTGISKVK